MTSKTTEPGTVYLVGAGPGIPGLMTQRAMDCLQHVDLICVDDAIDWPGLQLISATTPWVPWQRGTETQDASTSVTLDMVIKEVQGGKSVVLLSKGDLISESDCFALADKLRTMGVSYELIPGINPIAVASAYAEIPLTMQEPGSRVCIQSRNISVLTKNTLDRPLMAPLAFTLKSGELEFAISRLLQEGMRGETPTSVVAFAGMSRQMSVRGTLATLPQLAAAASLHGEVTMFIGEAVSRQPDQSWFDALPLKGQTVVVTRPRSQAGGLVNSLVRLGAEVFQLPVLEIGPAPDASVVLDTLRDLTCFQWLVFTSSNGVQAFMTYLEQTGQDLRALGRLKLAAIGPQTAAALASFHLRADVIPDEYRSEKLASQLQPLVQGQRVLLARADRGRDVLRAELAKVAQVTQVAVYAQHDRVEETAEFQKLLGSALPFWVTLTSANIARQFLSLLPAAARRGVGRTIRLVSISPVTTVTVKEMGYVVTAEATEYTAAGVIAALKVAVATWAAP